MIRLVKVCKRLGGQNILRELTLHVERGEVFAIMGGSGTGKSVTLKHMVGLLEPDRGEVWIDGANLAVLNRAQLKGLRRRFGYLFQSGALINWLNVGDNVALPLREHTRLGRTDIQQRVAERLRWVRLIGDEHKMPAEISGGMKKRVGLARAIVLNPDIVLYDEPTSGLDPVTARAIRALIREVNDRLEATSVMVTHDILDATDTADRIGFLFDGRIEFVGTPAEVERTDNARVKNFLKGLDDQTSVAEAVPS
ncbi:MAG: ABC transporter ATP-binding protein [Planctomycetes bacterium]|nr:ABC transporter ATP-binding protein [Planctomycetota bacterium]